MYIPTFQLLEYQKGLLRFHRHMFSIAVTAMVYYISTPRGPPIPVKKVQIWSDSEQNDAKLEM